MNDTQNNYNILLEAIETNKSLEFFRLNLPMVKWSDKEPWLIEDLKKLEVVEEYENDCR